MRLFRGPRGLTLPPKGCVASIGNYDGVHLGHQAVLASLREKGKDLGLPVALVMFEPMPQEYFAKSAPPARLTRFKEKWPLLETAGVDWLVCLRFDKTLAELEAEDFINQVLVRGLGVKHLTVGDDFRFGRGRRGDFGLLTEIGRVQGFEVTDTASLMQDGERVSSSRIRSLLIEGDMAGAARLLGRPFSLSGHVMHGERLGRTLGFPTANLALGRKTSPLGGIFAARVQGAGDGVRNAAAYVGRRPAVGGVKLVLEVHLLDYTGDLYGRQLRVEFLERLREDRHFDSLDALRAQMQEDVQAARTRLAAYRP